jgi:hypothetical protein
MSENWSRNQRQTSMTYSGIGNPAMPPSSVTGSNRSRRPSWSDAKVMKMILSFSCVILYFDVESLECRR